MISTKKRIGTALWMLTIALLLGLSFPTHAEDSCPCDDDPFYYDPLALFPTIDINGSLRAYAVASSDDTCGIVAVPEQEELWAMSRTFDIDKLGSASSQCTAYLNEILLASPSDTETSACGGTARADVDIVGNYEAYGTSKSVNVSMVHGAFHIPELSGGFSVDCCELEFPCASAYTGSETTDPFSVSIEFNVCKPTKVVVDVDLTILGCVGLETFDYFDAWFTLSGLGTFPLEECVDGYRFSILLQPGTYTLSAGFDYTITTGWWKTCFDEENQGTSKPVILLDASVLAGRQIGIGNQQP